ncbi:Uncharacterized protein QTN25_007789 [Entamoeba marina]
MNYLPYQPSIVQPLLQMDTIEEKPKKMISTKEQNTSKELKEQQEIYLQKLDKASELHIELSEKKQQYNLHQEEYNCLEQVNESLNSSIRDVENATYHIQELYFKEILKEMNQEIMGDKERVQNLFLQCIMTQIPMEKWKEWLISKQINNNKIN